MDTSVIDGRYRVVRKLGAGAFGDVILAVDMQEAGRLVALKTLKQQDKRSTQIEDEFEILRRLAHPNVGRVYDYGRHEDSFPYFTMEFIEGAPVTDVFGSPPPGAVIRNLLRQGFDALEYLHSSGIVHGDIKPANVLVTGTSRRPGLKLVDFGLASYIGVREKNDPRGTPRYVAPEVLLGAAPSFASDYYSYGAVLYEVVCGRPPYDGRTWDEVAENVLYGMPAQLRRLCPDTPLDIEATLSRMLARSEFARCASAFDLRGLLRKSCAKAGAVAARTVKLNALARPRFIDSSGALAAIRRSASEAASDGRCYFAAVSGEAGTGKSRLLEELNHEFQLCGIPVICLDCGSERGGGDGLFGSLIARLDKIASPGTSAEIRVDASDEGRDRAEVLAERLGRIPKNRPVALILDNVHLAPDWLAEAARRQSWRNGEGGVIMIAMTAPFADPDAGILARWREPGLSPSPAGFELKALDEEGIERFLTSMTACRTASRSLVAAMARSAGGLPGYLAETVTELARRGALVNARGELRLKAGARIEGPASLRESVHARLRLLDADEAKALRLLAIAESAIGQRDMAVLTGLSGRGAANILFRLQRDGLAEPDAGAWRLKRETTREHIISSAGAEERAELSRKLALHLESSGTASGDALARQFASAQMSEKALDYGLSAARDLLKVTERRRARELLEVLTACADGVPARMADVLELSAQVCFAEQRTEEALERLDRLIGLFDSGTPGERQRRARRMKAGALRQLGRFAESEIELRLAEPPDEEKAESVAQGMELARLLADSGRLDDATQQWRKIQPAAADMGNPRRAAEARLGLAGCLHTRGRLQEALDELEEVREAGDDDLAARREIQRSGAFFLMGDMRKALTALRRALRLAERADDLARISDISQRIAMCQIRTGRCEEAAMTLKRCLDTNVALGQPSLIRSALVVLISVSRNMGFFEESLEFLERYRELLPALPEVRRGDFLVQEAACRIAVGQVREATDASVRLEAWAAEKGHEHYVTTAMWLRAYALGSEKPSAGIELAREAAGRLRESGRRNDCGQCSNLLAHLLADAGRDEEALASLAEAEKMRDEAEDTAIALGLDITKARVLLKTGKGRPEECLALGRKCIDAARRLSLPHSAAEASIIAARACAATGRIKTAKRHVSTALLELDEMSGRIKSRKLRDAFTRSPLCREALDLALELAWEKR